MDVLPVSFEDERLQYGDVAVHERLHLRGDSKDVERRGVDHDVRLAQFLQ